MSNWFTERFIAHRGLFNNVDIPENSLLACQNAVDNNFPMEFDVQTSSDGVLVIFHDDTLDRMTNGTGKVCDYTYAELTQLKLLDTEETIPTLEQWLATVNGQVPLLMEFKPHSNVGGMEQAILDMLANYQGEICLESFDPAIVRWLNINAPTYTTGLLACAEYGKTIGKLTQWVLRNVLLRRWCKAKFIAYDITATKQMKKLQKLRKKMPVIVYTVKNQLQHDQNEYLYDNMIFDSFVPRR